MNFPARCRYCGSTIKLYRCEDYCHHIVTACPNELCNYINGTAGSCACNPDDTLPYDPTFGPFSFLSVEEDEERSVKWARKFRLSHKFSMEWMDTLQHAIVEDIIL